MEMVLLENNRFKVVRSKTYNYVFDKTNGYFERWGVSTKDDPPFSPFGPEILDLEISEGECLGNCPFCYKCNGSDVKTVNMTLDTFKTIFHKMPRILTQIAFGITNIGGNPDFFAMMEYARANGVIPNYTCHGLDVTEEVAKKTAATCGAVAVSIVRKEKTYDAIEMFSKAGMKQVNIHLVYHSKNENLVYQVLKDAVTDPRLKGRLNAIVLLGLKQKGRGKNGYEALGYDGFSKIIEFAMQNKVPIGFDSCSAPKYISWVRQSSYSDDRKTKMEMVAEPCESNLFSFYINCHGNSFPCSFLEGSEDWEEGISVLHCQDFVKDVWNNEKYLEWRKKLLGNCRHCPVYKV